MPSLGSWFRIDRMKHINEMSFTSFRKNSSCGKPSLSYESLIMEITFMKETINMIVKAPNKSPSPIFKPLKRTFSVRTLYRFPLTCFPMFNYASSLVKISFSSFCTKIYLLPLQTGRIASHLPMQIF